MKVRSILAFGGACLALAVAPGRSPSPDRRSACASKARARTLQAARTMHHAERLDHQVRRPRGRLPGRQRARSAQRRHQGPLEGHVLHQLQRLLDQLDPGRDAEREDRLLGDLGRQPLRHPRRLRGQGQAGRPDPVRRGLDQEARAPARHHRPGQGDRRQAVHAQDRLLQRQGQGQPRRRRPRERRRSEPRLGQAWDRRGLRRRPGHADVHRRRQGLHPRGRHDGEGDQVRRAAPGPHRAHRARRRIGVRRRAVWGPGPAPAPSTSTSPAASAAGRCAPRARRTCRGRRP